MKVEKLLIGVFVSVESAHAFSAFNPSLFTINRFRDQQTVQDITRGCIYASGFSLCIGLVSSLLIDSWFPLIMSVAVSVGMSMIYLREANKEVKT
jgi:ABC-type phosphate transport system permease subunit